MRRSQRQQPRWGRNDNPSLRGRPSKITSPQAYCGFSGTSMSSTKLGDSDDRRHEADRPSDRALLWRAVLLRLRQGHAWEHHGCETDSGKAGAIHFSDGARTRAERDVAGLPNLSQNGYGGAVMRCSTTRRRCSKRAATDFRRILRRRKAAAVYLRAQEFCFSLCMSRRLRGRARSAA